MKGVIQYEEVIECWSFCRVILTRFTFHEPSACPLVPPNHPPTRRRTCAMKMAVVASYSAVPLRLRLTPMGRKKLVVASSHPALTAARMARGREAAKWQGRV
jgi:hypothetical protein